MKTSNYTFAHITYWFGILGVILFVTTTVIAELLLPNYSPISQLISESYALDIEFGKQLRFIGYLPSGICIVLFSFMAIRILPKSSLTLIGFCGIGIGYGIATMIVSFFHAMQVAIRNLLIPVNRKSYIISQACSPIL